MAAEHEFPGGGDQAGEGRSEGSGPVGVRPPLSRRRKWCLAGTTIAVSAIVAGALIAYLSHSGTGVVYALIDRTDRPAPTFSLPEVLVPSRQLTLADFRGRPLVLNFWASWCYPCQTEMPLLESAYRSERGAVQFVGVDTDDTRKAAAAFLARTHVSYVSLFMPRPGPVSNAYQLVGLPITVFISARGRVLGRHVGQLNPATLRAAMDLAFGRRAST
ncbi:MAG TPA: TlpA disulfide reductase family protein [Acidimicrobiales bacterium]|nr:TlpA disulfide reductase family protein [Acidimicrobiales bacterium]